MSSALGFSASAVDVAGRGLTVVGARQVDRSPAYGNILEYLSPLPRHQPTLARLGTFREPLINLFRAPRLFPFVSETD